MGNHIGFLQALDGAEHPHRHEAAVLRHLRGQPEVTDGAAVIGFSRLM